MPDSTAPIDARAIVALPASGAPAQLLFLLFHGVGQEARHMAPLADALREQYPQAAVVSLNGPLPFDGGPKGFQWFSAQGIDDNNRAARVAEAVPAFVERVRVWAKHFGLDWPQVALAGFSQGAIMSLEAVQAEPALAGRVIAIGGRYASEPEQAPEQVCVHLLHGMADAVIPYAPVVSAAKTLVYLGADVTADILPDVGHELHPLLVDKAMTQLRSFIPKRLWQEAVIAAAEQDRQG